MMLYDEPVWKLMHEMVADLELRNGEVLSKAQVIAWFADHYPKVKGSTIDVHLTRLSTNASSRVHYNAKPGRDDLLFKIDPHHFRLYSPDSDPSPIYAASTRVFGPRGLGSNRIGSRAPLHLSTTRSQSQLSGRDAEWKRLAALYDLERYLFEVVSPGFQRDGTLSSYDFFAIIIWKSNRSKTKIKRGLAAARTSVAELMSEVSEAPTAPAKLDTLVRISGIGLAIASAILTVCYPEEFTVLDYRAWDTAKKERVDSLPGRKPQTPTEYLQYRRACQLFAAELGVSLRSLDRALWARSWESDLERLISEMQPASEPEVPVGADEEVGPATRGGGSHMTIHVEVYLASRMLGRQHGDFARSELIERVRREFGDNRPGVSTYATAHAVANAPKNTTVVYNYLWRLDLGRYRCFDPARDRPHPTRIDARHQPRRVDVPHMYRNYLADEDRL